MDFERSKNWLSQSALPFWLEHGLDKEGGGFIETLSLEGEPLRDPKRCMVQARQIYTFKTATEHGLCDPEAGKRAVESGADLLLSRYALESGAFRHSITAAGEPLEEVSDLYGQAFVLFGLANAYAVLGRPDLRMSAKKLLAYLYRERKLPEGGFSEIEKGRVVYRSNPHMHLFEAAVSWMEVDADPDWHRLAAEILNLCLARFIDPSTGALGESFTEGWARVLGLGGTFIYEPGHLFEWAWLMGRFQNLSGRELGPVRRRLFELSEKTGISPESGAVLDQMNSDFSPRLRSSRFWPQCERIKAAAQLGKKEEARLAMGVLLRYFSAPRPGLWYDTLEENGVFRNQPVKASSLYHIVGAITEYQSLNR